MAYQEVDISTIRDREVYQSLCIPSGIHTYSLAVQYMQNWFLSKVPEGYFKSVYVNEKHVFDDFRTMNQTQQLKRLKLM